MNSVEYTSVPLAEETLAPQSSSAPRSQAPSTQSDGVFSNLSAKPNATKEFEELEPPPYNDAPAYEYGGAMFTTPAPGSATIGEDGDVLVDGMEVGSTSPQHLFSLPI
jgi:hypothetical protein